MAETRIENISPIKIWRWLCEPSPHIGKGQLLNPPRYDKLTPPENFVSFARSCIGTTYAMGGLMTVPWDVWQNNNGGPRYFGSTADYADIYGFVRAIPELFDGYEAVFCRGEEIPTSTYGFEQSPVVLQGDHDGVVVVVRCKPKSDMAPVVIHLIDWDRCEPFTLILDQNQFFHGGTIVLDLLSPTKYKRELHESVLSASDYSRLLDTQRLKPEIHPDGKLRFQIPALHPWGIVRVSRK